MDTLNHIVAVDARALFLQQCAQGRLRVQRVLGYLPMSALAALLLLVAWNMSDARHFTHIVRVAPKSDVAVLLTCFLLTVTFDMVVGVSVGMVLAAFMFMRRMAEVTESKLVESAHLALPGVLPEGVVVYEISGPLFFSAAQKAMTTLHVVAGEGDGGGASDGRRARPGHDGAGRVRERAGRAA
jgi:MFS superfamily sulfate permease-like transporter